MSRRRRRSRRRRADIVNELRALARSLGRPPNAHQLPSPLWDDLVIRFQSMAAARRAAGLGRAPQPSRRKWSRARAIEELRRLHDAGVEITRDDVYDQPTGSALMSAISRYIGGLRRARVLAGIPTPPRGEPRTRWSARALVNEIRGRFTRKEPLAWSRVPSELRRAAKSCFGGWERAVIAAGLVYDRIRLHHRAYSEADLLAGLRRLRRRRPTMTRTELARTSLGDAVARKLGSVQRGLDVAGIQGWPRVVHARLYSRREIIDRLRARHESGRRSERFVVKREEPRLARAVERRFPTWRAAMAAARVPYMRATRIWTRARVIKALRDRIDAGQPVHWHALVYQDSGLLMGAKRIFGSGRRMLEALGLPQRQIAWSRERVIADLQRMARQGVHVSAEAMPATLQQAARRYFGTIVAARTAAGIAFVRRSKWSARPELARQRVRPTTRARSTRG